MDLIETLRSTGTVREFTDEPVDDAVLARVLDTAPFAPSGANAQAWRVVVVKDSRSGPACVTSTFRLDRVPGDRAAGLRPWSTVNDPAAERDALAGAARRWSTRPRKVSPGTSTRRRCCWRCSPTWRSWPRWTATCSGTRSPAARRSTRSPGTFCWPRAPKASVVSSTMLIRQEDEVKRLLGADGALALAAVIALGHPVHQPRRLRRNPVE